MAAGGAEGALICPFFFLIKEDGERFWWKKAFQYLIFLLTILSI